MKQLVNLKIGIILMIILSSSCGISASRNRDLQALQEIHNSVDKIDRKIGDPYDINDLNGCPVLASLTTWGGVKSNRKTTREYRWRDTNWESINRSTVDAASYKIEDIAKNNQKFHIVYIGPWKLVPKLNKNIRFFTFQQKGHMEMDYGFESMKETNKNIPEKSYSLSKETGFELPDRESSCYTKWIAKYGYNAIAEVKYPGFFNSIFKINPVPTGKIIEARE